MYRQKNRKKFQLELKRGCEKPLNKERFVHYYNNKKSFLSNFTGVTIDPSKHCGYASHCTN